MTDIPQVNNDITIHSNVILRGHAKGTILDYNSNKFGTFTILYAQKQKTFKLENFIVKNYRGVSEDDNDSNLPLFDISNAKVGDDFNFVVKNCQFMNIAYDIFTFHIDSSAETNKNYPITFDSCQFIDNDERIITIYHHEYSYFYAELYLAIKLKMYNCRFVRNKGLFLINNALVLFDSCYFSEIERDNYDTTQGVLLTTNFNNEYIIFKNSTIENVNVQSPLPLIYGNSMTLEFKDSIIKNCHTKAGSLIEFNKHWGNRKSKFENSQFINTSTIIKSNKGDFIFSNCIFQDSVIKSPIPAIADSTDSKITLTNVKISNLKIMGYLINNLSTLSTLTNITLDNVYTNAKALFHFINVDATFNILNVNNIKCAGDADDSSLILFEAAEKHHELRINYLTAKNSLSNGSFIKLLGSSVRLAFRYFTIDNLTIYGSVIESKSLSTEIILKYSTFSNSMNVKKNGCGIVHLNNNLNITISNNEFINNHNKCNGGVICFDNISSMTIRLSSNNFEENSAISGGALYFADSTLTTPMTIKEEDQESSIRSNTFINNQVETFGGAIYSSYNKMYLVSVKNNTITGNKANIAGAGIFAPKMVNQTMLSLKGNTLDKNVVGTNLNMYSSNPSHIKLNSTMTSSSIRSGDLFPLAFTLHDHFDNILEDFSNFYSSITLKLFLLQRKERKEEGEEEEEYGDEDEEEVDHFKNKNFYLKGNIGQFINGRCELNNFYIYANTGTYQLKAMIENYNEEITMDFNIIIHVNGCDANQVKLFKNEILYCENPICRANCPDKISATCISPNEFINDIRQNNCHCNEGYTGNDCNEKIFINFSTFNRILLIITIIMTIIIASFILFVLIYRRQSIISDIGIFKILFFSIGILLFYISILFSTYTDYKGCSLYVFFKHTGIAMVLGTFYILTIINYKLGHSLKFKKISQSQDIDEESIEENDLPLFDNSKALVLDTSDNGHIKKINFNNASSLSITSTSVREGLKKVIDVEKKKEEEGFGEYNENIIKKIKKVKSLYLEVILAFPLYLISILLIIVIQLRQEERDTADAPQSYIVQNKDAKWTYQCNLIKTDNVYSTIEFMVFAAILWRGNTMTKFENIFKYISYITYCAWVGIFFGPLVNFLGQIILSNQRYGKVIFTTLLNSVCYLAIFIIFVWEIVVLILTNKGNERGTYFIYKRHDYCAIHESTVCGCKLKMDKTELSVYIKRSIDFYAICSLLYEIVDGKLIYVNNKSKIKILNHV